MSAFGIRLVLFCSLAALPVAAKELRFTIPGDPRSFDPLHSTEQNGEIIRYITSGVLLRDNRTTGVIEPVLAESWKLSDRGATINIRLKPSLRFSDGTPLTAADVERTLRIALDPKDAAPAGDIFRSSSGDPQIHVLSDREIVVHYAVPKPGLEQAFDTLAIVPPRSGSRFPATAGPFYVAEYKPGEYIRLLRNPWFKPLPPLDSIRVDIQENRDIELSRFLKGDLNLMNNLDADSFEQIRTKMPQAAVDLGPSMDVEFLWFNQSPARNLPEWKRTWFRSTAFRHAISASLHRDDIVRLVYKGYAHPAAGPFSPANIFWYNHNLQPRTYDPAASARLLAQDGFINRGGILYDQAGHPVEFSLITNAGNKSRERTAAIIQDDLRKIGIRVNIAALEFGSLVERISKTADYEACLLGFTNVDVDPSAQNNVWLSSGAHHPWWPEQKAPSTGWEREIDSLTLKQASEPDRTKRKQAFDRVQQLVYEQEPLIYLVNKDSLAAVSPAVHGTLPTALTPQLLWNVGNVGID
jgi:peptide/nickel transport system substrate-binding protein